MVGMHYYKNPIKDRRQLADRKSYDPLGNILLSIAQSVAVVILPRIMV
jgi:hypothetical protein